MNANDADPALIDSGDVDFFARAPAHESNFTLSLPFQKTAVAADTGDTPSAAETAKLAALLLDDGTEVSAGIAEQERINRPTPTVFLPGNKQRSTRSVLTIVVSILTVLALVAVGILFAVKSQATTPEQKAFEAYSAQQVTVETAARKLTSTYDAVGTARMDADTVNVAAAAALAAVVGVSDEPARAAADAQRTAVAATIAGITATDPAEIPYVAPEVTASSSLSIIAGGLDVLTAEATRIEDAQVELNAALTAITDARATFTKSFTAFADTIPTTAAALLTANPEAGKEWRDAVTNAVTEFVAAVEKGGGVTELQAYAAAAFTLQDENARVLHEEGLREGEAVEGDADDAPRRTPTGPRATTPPSSGETTTPPPSGETTDPPPSGGESTEPPGDETPEEPAPGGPSIMPEVFAW